MMNSTEYIKSKTHTGVNAGVISVKDALKAIELAKLEGQIEALKQAGHYTREVKLSVMSSEAFAKKKTLLETI